MDVNLKGNPWWHSIVNIFNGFSDYRESRLFQLTDDIKLEEIATGLSMGHRKIRVGQTDEPKSAMKFNRKYKSLNRLENVMQHV